ncbi:helix-turn-helix domain-containing protein [Streptomyces sp. NPDC127117]|uniref:helix-turn-helix domain-containing protein n=1 Tax=Streptomyces sp. NPDC127117 TaxID=3345368 RepID=UPI0036422E39
MVDNDAPDAPEEQTTELADLIRARRAELGLSLAAFADRAIDPRTGEQAVKYGWVHRLESGEPVNAPKLGQLRAIAAAARVPFSVVQDAAGAQFFDIRTVWSASGEARALVQQAEQLTERQREQLRLFLATFEPDSGPSGE